MNPRDGSAASRDPPAAPGHREAHQAGQPNGTGHREAHQAGQSNGTAGAVRRVADLLAARPWHVAIGSLALGLALATGPAAATLVAAAAALALLCGCGAAALGALCAALVLGGAALGDARLHAIDRPAALVVDGRTVDVSAHLLSTPRPSAFGASAEVRVAGGRLDGTRLLLRVPRWSGLPPGVRIGDELRLQGRLRRIDVRPGRPGDDRTRPSEGSFDFAAYLRRRGIAGELLLDRARATGRHRGGICPCARPHARTCTAGRRRRAAQFRGRARARDGARPGRGDRGGSARGLPGERPGSPAGGQRAERDAARRARAAAARRGRARPARPRRRCCSGWSRSTCRWPAPGRRCSARA